MFSRSINKNFIINATNKNKTYNFNKQKELLSVSKANNNIKNIPKYSKCPRVQSYYSRPFDYKLKFGIQNGEKRHYYVNPQKPPEEDPILYIILGLSYLTYLYVDKPPPPPSHPSHY